MSGTNNRACDSMLCGNVEHSLSQVLLPEARTFDSLTLEAGMEDPISPSDIELIGTTVSSVTRLYSCGPTQRYYIYHSQVLLEPPRQQGDVGDFFVNPTMVFYKSLSLKWVRAHFHRGTRHPKLDLYLAYDECGPIWAKRPGPILQTLPEMPLPIAARFHLALALSNREPGSVPDDPIILH